MKTITAREHDLITAVIGDGLTTLAEAVLEKDLLLTEVLQAINATDKDGIGLVFCGGTCLSKAHGLIDRMSEDIDFKLGRAAGPVTQRTQSDAESVQKTAGPRFSATGLSCSSRPDRGA